MAHGKLWTMTLRCHACSHRFVVGEITIDRIPIIPQITPCPSCSAKSVAAIAEDNSPVLKTHKILDLKPKNLN
jgi:hypothetical protein